MSKSISSASGSSRPAAQQGNLTGPARVLNDIIVSFYNAIQKWNGAYLSGVGIVQGIQEKNECGNEFQSSCEKLGDIVDILGAQSTLLFTLADKLKSGLQLFASHQHETSRDPLAGISWNYSNFVKSTLTIATCYSMETCRKKKISLLLKEYGPLSKEFEVLTLAWIQLSALGPEQDALLKALQYEANLVTTPTWES